MDVEGAAQDNGASAGRISVVNRVILLVAGNLDLVGRRQSGVGPSLDPVMRVGMLWVVEVGHEAGSHELEATCSAGRVLAADQDAMHGYLVERVIASLVGLLVGVGARFVMGYDGVRYDDFHVFRCHRFSSQMDAVDQIGE
ncbi:hypothetical protein SDC9_170992 [bioreactor metagenome]|uniref:Uncharacterized protein n=1 Tax=bioreactor metagenome TaxID=1076179 RepID=A0A645GC15_9ZZZZ